MDETMNKRVETLKASLPMSIQDLGDLFDYIERPSTPECDHTLMQTRKFLESRELDAEEIVPWLNGHGGYCDCEVMLNVYERVGDIVECYLDEEK